MLTETPFYYLRHGETDWNRDGRVQGWTDVPLNATGLAQARAAAELVRDLGIRAICASPLARALDTARIVAAAIGTPIDVIDDLRECGFGVREGDTKGPWYEAWKSGTTPEGGEPFRAFLRRALRGINRALESEGPVLIVAHGGVYAAIREHARIELAAELPNGRPIRHDPPRADHPWWQHLVIGVAGADPYSA